MEQAESTWSALLSRMPQVREFADDCDGLSARVAGLAGRLDRFVEDNAVTLIHGDCKAWNLFFNEERALFIDLQWVGRGHPMQVSESCLRHSYVLLIISWTMDIQCQLEEEDLLSISLQGL